MRQNGGSTHFYRLCCTHERQSRTYQKRTRPEAEVSGNISDTSDSFSVSTFLRTLAPYILESSSSPEAMIYSYSTLVNCQMYHERKTIIAKSKKLTAGIVIRVRKSMTKASAAAHTIMRAFAAFAARRRLYGNEVLAVPGVQHISFVSCHGYPPHAIIFFYILRLLDYYNCIM